MLIRTTWLRRSAIVAAVVALISTGLVVDGRSGTTSPPRCGAHDLPEAADQLQGDVPVRDRAEDDAGVSRAEQGYNCGLALVGHTTLGHGVLDGSNRNARSNANMAWSGDCAYVSGPGTTFGPTTYDSTKDDRNGIAVVDVSDPTRPTHVRTLIGTPASTKTSETLYAVDAPARDGFPERHVLVVGQYGNAGSGVLKPMDVYDVSDCADPQLIGTYLWQENIHNLTISGNGKYVFATQPLQMVDIDPLFDGDPATDAVYLGDIERDMPYPLVPFGPGPDADDELPAPVREANRNGYSSHQAWSDFDGTRLYLGSQTPQYEAFTIVDLQPWIDSTIPGTFLHTERPVVLSQSMGRGHSVSVGDIGEQKWALHAEESVFGQANDCNHELTRAISPNYGATPFVGVAEPFLSDVTDPSNPEMHVSRLGLEINRPENCDAQKASGVQASVHYHEFDDEQDTKFAILSMQNAGIRVFDVRDPAHPVEVAYFNPGDVNNPSDDPATPENEAADGAVTLDYAWGHPRYNAETGHIWFATRAGGFWVVELEQQLRNHFRLGRGAAPSRPNGAPGAVGVNRTAVLPALDVDPGYCTLGRPV